jgi:hypothetical protein
VRDSLPEASPDTSSLNAWCRTMGPAISFGKKVTKRQ